MGWATVTMAGDTEERAVVTASMDAIGQGIMAGTQVVPYAATDAPRFKGGFASNLATSHAQLVLISAILWLSHRDQKMIKEFQRTGWAKGEMRYVSCKT